MDYHDHTTNQPATNRWQVEWIDLDGDHHTRMFKIEANARGFASTVPCADGFKAELWGMYGPEAGPYNGGVEEWRHP